MYFLLYYAQFLFILIVFIITFYYVDFRLLSVFRVIFFMFWFVLFLIFLFSFLFSKGDNFLFCNFSNKKNTDLKRSVFLIFPHFLTGGSEGSRTPVRKLFPRCFYVCSCLFIYLVSSIAEQQAIPSTSHN